MTSPRASTPASDAGSTASPMQLTPRSKVKAMLAAMDDSDEEGNATPLPKPKPKSLFANLAKPTRRDSIDDATQDAATAGDSEEEDEDITKPRGRMAARMRAAQLSDQESDARERVKKMLAAESANTKEPTPNAEVENASSEDDEDIPVVSRKRQIRNVRSPTPQPKTGARNSESPGMFVSPGSDRRSRPASAAASDSDSDLPLNPNTDSRFKALVQKKREERKAREAELAEEKAEKAAKRKNFSNMLDEDEELDVTDSETEQRMTQQVKSTRKASKRAVEEMKRETQRMSRNMQLAHKALTKKKITKESLFAKFNYRQPKDEDLQSTDRTRVPSSSSAMQSESEAKETTPPTSPSLNVNEAPKTPLRTPRSVPAQDDEDDDEDLTSLDQVLAQRPKGKGKTGQEIPSSPPKLQNRSENETDLAHDHGRGKLMKQPSAASDSDSDLEITCSAPRVRNRKTKIDEIFDRVPARRANEPHSLQNLRFLAHLNSPGKNSRSKNKSLMTNGELQLTLHQRIRQQAARGRAEREQSLRDRGIVVLTAEEREKEMADVENLITKARLEADELMKNEKNEAKRQRKENGEVDPLGDSSDDEDWQEEKGEVEVELSGSGSEDELSPEDDDGDVSGEEGDEGQAMSEDEQADESNAKPGTALIDNEASETNSEEETGLDIAEEEDITEISDKEEDDDVLPAAPGRRRTKNTNIISDDEEEGELNTRPVASTPAVKHFASPMPPKTASPVAPTSVLRSARKTFIPGLSVAGPAGLGLTQIFQGTMDDSQMEDYSDTAMIPETSSGGKEEDPTSFLRRMPPPSLPAFESTVDEEPQDVIMDSQPGISQVPASQPLDEISQPIQMQFSQSQIHGFDTLDPFSTQYSEHPDQTQDVGFQTRSPIVNRFVSQTQATQSTIPPSTVNKVLTEPSPTIPEEIGDSPMVKKLGRLRRRNQIRRLSNEDEASPTREMIGEEGEGFDISADAFNVMRKAAKKKILADDFDKKKSKAKEYVNEQAEESEDEYAGLGGASDDESDGDDALVNEMIDDEAGKDADERELAAFYADKERAKDSKDVEKLFKDITNGMLRRKRGGDFSLSDSEDDGEARRNQKRKEFARMRKALLEDERIGKIAQNPKQAAFLAAMEDREKDEEIDFLDNYQDSQEALESESQEESQARDTEMTDGVQVPGSQPDTSMAPPKRKRSDGNGSDVENRLPPHLRRTKGTKRPSNLAEIRESLSSLIEEPNSMLAANESDSDSGLEIVDENEEEGGSGSGTDRESRRNSERDPFASRRTRNFEVVDRISLKRASSSNISSNTKLAFAAPATTSLYNVKVPPLRRQATSSSLSTSSGISSMGNNKNSLEAAGLSGIKRGGSRTSGIAYQARETERRKLVDEGEKRREKRKFKGVEKRREAVGGLFGKGKFE